MKNDLLENTSPPVLNADELATYLNVSRAGAYQLLNRADFPTLRVGKRLLVPRDQLLRWIDAHTQEDGKD